MSNKVKIKFKDFSLVSNVGVNVFYELSLPSFYEKESINIEWIKIEGQVHSSTGSFYFSPTIRNLNINEVLNGIIYIAKGIVPVKIVVFKISYKVSNVDEIVEILKDDIVVEDSISEKNGSNYFLTLDKIKQRNDETIDNLIRTYKNSKIFSIITFCFVVIGIIAYFVFLINVFEIFE